MVSCGSNRCFFSIFLLLQSHHFDCFLPVDPGGLIMMEIENGNVTPTSKVESTSLFGPLWLWLRFLDVLHLFVVTIGTFLHQWFGVYNSLWEAGKFKDTFCVFFELILLSCATSGLY
jgi:hypothetical protein